jgi:esterase/lipase superfamily enzyme
MITNRNVETDGLGQELDKLTYYTSDAGDLTRLKNWRQRPKKEFQDALIAAADKFPEVPQEQNEAQKHVSFFIHGYNNSWIDAVKRYQQIVKDLYSGKSALGLCVLFTWPSNGSQFGYLPDREDARASGPGLAGVLNDLYQHAFLMQQKAASGTGLCKAKVSIIAHSMGNWVLQNALQYTWEHQNKPLLTSLINQCLMVAADVDNDLFAGGETIGKGEGEGMANLCYRIAALYSGRDSVLGMSSGLKHFGKRRLGRSGLDKETTEPDNVWDLDCSKIFPPSEDNIHSAYFWTKGTQKIMRDILQGYDRKIIEAQAKKYLIPSFGKSRRERD